MTYYGKTTHKNPEDQRLLSELRQELEGLGRSARLLLEFLDHLDESPTSLTDNELNALEHLGSDLRGAASNFQKKLGQRLTPTTA